MTRRISFAGRCRNEGELSDCVDCGSRGGRALRIHTACGRWKAVFERSVGDPIRPGYGEDRTCRAGRDASADWTRRAPVHRVGEQDFKNYDPGKFDYTAH